jgi:uncharacterized membrane protein YgaE (UPF0421/DUF939 family)
MDGKNGKYESSSTMKAAVIGAAVGALMVALADKDKREKIIDKVDEVKTKGGKVLKETRSKVNKKKAESQKQLADRLREVADSMEAQA